MFPGYPLKIYLQRSNTRVAIKIIIVYTQVQRARNIAVVFL